MRRPTETAQRCMWQHQDTYNLFRKRDGAPEKDQKYKNPNPTAVRIILCTLVLVKQNGWQEQLRSEQPPHGAAGELKSK